MRLRQLDRGRRARLDEVRIGKIDRNEDLLEHGELLPKRAQTDDAHSDTARGGA